MGVLERMKQRESTAHLPQKESLSTTPEQAEPKSIQLQRVQLMMGFLMGQIKGDVKADKMRRLLTMIVEEAMSDLDDAPAEVLEFYFKRAAGMMYWSATGEKVENLPWPSNFNPPAGLSAEPTAIDLPVKELEA